MKIFKNFIISLNIHFISKLNNPEKPINHMEEEKENALRNPKLEDCDENSGEC